MEKLLYSSSDPPQSFKNDENLCNKFLIWIMKREYSVHLLVKYVFIVKQIDLIVLCFSPC